jgi:hypothetical protein
MGVADSHIQVLVLAGVLVDAQTPVSQLALGGALRDHALIDGEGNAVAMAAAQCDFDLFSRGHGFADLTFEST